MQKESLLQLGIEEETADQILKAINEEMEEYILKSDFEALQEKYDTDIENLSNMLSETNKNNAIDLAILKASGKDPKEIKVNFELDKIKLNKDGTLEGFDIESLKKSKPYLFNIEEKKTEGTGVTQGTKISEIESAKAKFENAVYGKGGF